MSKQLFLYEDVKPISSTRHGDWSIKTGGDWLFASKVNSVPLLVSEFAQAARYFPIVFSGSGARLVPIAVLGIRNEQNLFVDPDGSWNVPYIPAFVRQYPFVLAQAKEPDTQMLCLDEAYGGCNRDGRGERLFDSDGRRTGYLDKMLGFAKTYQAQFRVSEAFGTRLHELGLLEPMRAQFKMEGLQDEVLSGFQSIVRAKLTDIPDQDILRMQRNGMLEAIYMQLLSAGNFDDITQRLHRLETAG